MKISQPVVNRIDQVNQIENQKINSYLMLLVSMLVEIWRFYIVNVFSLCLPKNNNLTTFLYILSSKNACECCIPRQSQRGILVFSHIAQPQMVQHYEWLGFFAISVSFLMRNPILWIHYIFVYRCITTHTNRLMFAFHANFSFQISENICENAWIDHHAQHSHHKFVAHFRNRISYESIIIFYPCSGFQIVSGWLLFVF